MCLDSDVKMVVVVRCSYSYLLLLLILFYNSGRSEGRYPLSKEARIRNFLLNQANFSARERPILDSDYAVHVSISMHLYGMLDLNERDQVITTASWISLRWKDERLSWNSTDFGGEDNVIMFIDEIWTPKIFVSNAVDSSSLNIISPERGICILLTSDGSLTLGSSLVLSTQCPISIRYFPFDTQVCPFRYYSQNQHTEKLVLSARSVDFQPLKVSDWSYYNISHHNITFMPRDFATNVPRANLSVALFCIYLVRHPNYYIVLVMLPSTVLCLMVYLTFVTPPDGGERISLSVSTILGLTVFQLLLSDILPATTELPILSIYLTITFISACLAVPLSVAHINISYGDSKFLALRHRYTRKLFLEYLPRLTGIPSYSERIRNINEENETKARDISPQEDDESTEETGGISLTSLEEQVSRTERRKLEARTAALVMDRLVSMTFMIVFITVFIKTVIIFKGKPEVNSDKCK